MKKMFNAWGPWIFLLLQIFNIVIFVKEGEYFTAIWVLVATGFAAKWIFAEQMTHDLTKENLCLAHQLLLTTRKLSETLKNKEDER